MGIRIYRRDGSETYYADIRFRHPITREKERKRKATPFGSKRKARRWAEDKLSDWTRREWWERKAEQERIENTPTVEEYAEHFLDKKSLEVEPSTVTSYGYRLVHIVETLGHLKLHEVSSTDFDTLTAYLLQHGKKPKTIKNTQGVLSGLLSMAVDEGLREEVPAFDWIKVPDPDWHRLKQDQAQAIVDSAYGDAGQYPIGLIVFTALHTGMRRGELLALKWQKVDTQTKRIFIHFSKDTRTGDLKPTKGKRNRTIPVSQDLADRLAEYRGQQAERHVTQFVFTDGDGEPVTKGRIYEPLRRAYDRCDEIPDNIGGWHVFRHTYASHLASSGTPLRVIQRLLGHQSLSQTERYAHLLPGTEKMAVPHLDGYLR